VDEAFSFFLDATRPELERAKQLVDLVGARSGTEDSAYVREWCKELRIGLIQQQGELVKVEVRTERLDGPLPTLGTGDWIKAGTFDRRVALVTPAVQYFAPGHIFVDAILQNAQLTSDARATAFFRDLGGKGRGRVFCVVIGRLGPSQSALSGDEAPATFRRAEHHLPVEWVRAAFEINPDGDLVPIPPGSLFQALTRDLQPSDRKCHPDEMSQVLENHPGLWVGLHAAVNVAPEAILLQKADEVEAAADELEDTLRGEMAYLRTQMDSRATNDAARAFREREALLTSVRNPSVVIDAVAIVIGSSER
jgi:hypothetical protein